MVCETGKVDIFTVLYFLSVSTIYITIITNTGTKIIIKPYWEVKRNKMKYVVWVVEGVVKES